MLWYSNNRFGNVGVLHTHPYLQMNLFILREQSDGFGIPEDDFQVLGSEVCSTVF